MAWWAHYSWRWIDWRDLPLVVRMIAGTLRRNCIAQRKDSWDLIYEFRFKKHWLSIP